MQKLTKEEFNNLIKSTIAKQDYSITVNDKDNKPIKKLLSRKGRIYLGSNFSIGLNQYKDDIYLSVDFYSVDDRMEIAKNNKNNPKPDQTDYI